MASGHVNRINRPNTWLHRPMLRREVLTCQPGAVHTWHLADQSAPEKGSPLCPRMRTFRLNVIGASGPLST
jgi:hypothetical protein